ncbi:hypothetical protein KL921_003920 [Ogataea angusta]|nr:hypothetical protein KL921_003920 [Ogataea angusta]
MSFIYDRAAGARVARRAGGGRSGAPMAAGADLCGRPGSRSGRAGPSATAECRAAKNILAGHVVLHGFWEQLSVVYSEILTTPEPSHVSEFNEYKVSIVALVLYKLQVLSENKRVVLSDSAAVVQRLGAIFVSKNDTLDDLKRFRVQNLVSVEQLAGQYGMSFSRKAETGSGTGSAEG